MPGGVAGDRPVSAGRPYADLGRQIQLVGFLFEFDEVGPGVFAEAMLLTARLSTLLERGTLGAPAIMRHIGQHRYGHAAGARKNRGRQADCTVLHDGRGGHLAATGAALVIARAAEHLLQIIVGTRQALDPVTVEQPVAIAVRDLHEVLHSVAHGGAPAAGSAGPGPRSG